MLASMGHEIHDDVIKWKHFPCYWPFVWGIHWSPVNSPRKGQWRGALLFSLICAWINGWVNNHEAGDLRHHCAHYDVTLMLPAGPLYPVTCTMAVGKWWCKEITENWHWANIVLIYCGIVVHGCFLLYWWIICFINMGWVCLVIWCYEFVTPNVPCHLLVKICDFFLAVSLLHIFIQSISLSTLNSFPFHCNMHMLC